MRRFMVVQAFLLALSLVAGFSVGDARAGVPCAYGSGGGFGDGFYCESGGFENMGTGCLGLANTSGKDVKVTVNTSHPIYQKLFKAGVGQNADFKFTYFSVTNCKVQNGGNWEPVPCNTVFEITQNTGQGRWLRVRTF